jgi:NTP pyrophosphatase (non-canonical NTP hydrolase)
MTFEEYQQAARSTALYPAEHRVTYPALGLVGEAGEIANKIKKTLRGDKPIDRDMLADEIGDVLWYLAALANDLDLSLDDIARRNVEKLSDRKARGVIKGDGDRR